MSQTIGAIRTDLMAEFGLSETNSNDGTNSARVLGYMNKAHEAFINHRSWTFNQGLFSLNNVANSSLAADLLIGAGTATLSDSSAWPVSGKINVNNDLIDFSANAANILTITSSQIDRKHYSGEKVWLLYAMPSDYAKPSEIRVSGSLYLPEDIRVDFEPLIKRFWQHHIVDAVTGVYTVYLQFPWSLGAGTIYIKYSKRPVDLTDQDPSTYVVNIPNPHYVNYITFYTMGRMYRHLENGVQADFYDAKAKQELALGATYDSKQHTSTKNPVRTRWDNPRDVMYRNSYSRSR